MGDIYNIPIGVSNILYHYLLVQSDYDLERLRKLYEAEFLIHPDRKEIKQILLTIDNIVTERGLTVKQQ